MRFYTQAKELFRSTVAGLLLILGLAVGMGAQTLPKPAVPPTPATLPLTQTVAPGFDDLGFIQYASVDTMCDAATALSATGY